MKRNPYLLILAGLLFLLPALTAEAQFRDRAPTGYDYTGPILKQNSTPESTGLLSGLFNGVQMQMGHSYSMNFMSMGGQYQNVNMYTNTMHFGFTDNLSGRLDVSMMHSPFGGSFSNGLYGNNGPDARIMIRNAELNYQLGQNSHIRLQFQQSPSPFSPYGGYGYGMGYDTFYDRNINPYFAR